jgi:WD40 repeat protein
VVATIVAARVPEVIQSHTSPDGRWRVDVVAYPCDEEATSVEHEKKLEQLILVDPQTGTETVVQSQRLTCGSALGAAGLGGLFWSRDSEIFYYTDAREGVPDGGGGICWDRPLWRMHVDEGKAEHHADVWARSRSGDQLAVVRKGEEIVVETLGGERISSAPIPHDREACQIAWCPEGNTFAYLRTRDPFQPGPWDVVCVDGQAGASNVALELQDTASVSMTWDSPTEITVSGLQNGERKTWTIDRPCATLGIKPSPPSTDTVLLAQADGSLVLHPLSGGPEREVLGPGLYDISGDAFLTRIVSPVRLSPDGRWLLVPTPEDGTWLVSLDGETCRQVAPQRLTATWAPDSRRIVFREEPGPGSEGQESEISIQGVVDGRKPRVLAQLPGKAWFPIWSPDCGDPSSNQIAAFSTEAGTATVWLLDAGSGERRSLGQFIAQATEGAPGMIRWSPDCKEV